MRMQLLSAMTVATLAAPPAFCVESTEPNPRELVLSLLRNGVPTGIVVPGEVLRSARQVERSEAPGAHAPWQLNAALDHFNSGHGRFRASNDTGVVHLRDSELPGDVAAVLERSAPIGRSLRIPVLGAVFRQGVMAMGGYEPQSIIGSGADVKPTAECPLLAPVDVEQGPTTPTELFDSLVRQVPGIAWVVTYERMPDSSLNLRVGLMCSDGKHLTIAVHR
jgi:hypothetical protein